MSVIKSVNFSSVIRAAVRKDLACLELSAAVKDAACKYARQGGAKPLLDALVIDCTTSPSGKARTPAKGTVTACVLTALQTILEQGPKSLARDPKHEERDAIADAFAQTIGTAFDLAVIDGSNARKAATAAKKAEKEETATTATGTASDTAETATDATGTATDAGTDYKALYLAALAENTRLKAQIEGLQQPAPRKVRSVKAA
jgi:hypothetical protein